ncbi:hypothetical protein BDFB_013526, partial [Asbolus verrucosus]
MASGDGIDENGIAGGATATIGLEVVSDLNVLNQVRKWNVTFDRKADVVIFIEWVEELGDSYQIPNGQLLRALYEMLRKQPFCGSEITNNSGTLADFKSYYFPTEFRDDLEDEISKRMQHENESGKDFLVHMQTLLQRHGGYSKERELKVIYRHLRPEYRQYIHSQDATSILKLLQQIHDYEQLASELRGQKTKQRTEYKSPVNNIGTPRPNNQRFSPAKSPENPLKEP